MTAFANTTQKNLLRLALWTPEADFLGRAIGNIGAFEQMSYPRSLPSFFYFCRCLQANYDLPLGEEYARLIEGLMGI